MDHDTVPLSDLDAESFTVVLTLSERSYEVREGESILGHLIADGLDIAFSCQEGVCGACETKVLEGTPIHRDSVASPAEHDERGTMMICCSGCSSPRLVLEL